MTNALATRQTTAVMTEDRERLLRNLIMKGASEDQVQLIMTICQRYQFDPLLKHVVLISGSLYVTRDGLLDNAHRSGKFDGIRVSAEQDNNGKWLATATVWVKGMGHPVEYTAYQPEHENPQSPAWKKSPRAMTVKCAEVMALKRAFNISLGTAEEMGHDEHVVDVGALSVAVEHASQSHGTMPEYEDAGSAWLESGDEPEDIAVTAQRDEIIEAIRDSQTAGALRIAGRAAVDAGFRDDARVKAALRDAQRRFSDTSAASGQPTLIEA